MRMVREHTHTERERESDHKEFKLINWRRNTREKERRAHEAIAFGSAGSLVGDDDGLEDLAELLEVAAELLRRRLPSQSPDEDLGPSRVAESRSVLRTRSRR